VIFLPIVQKWGGEPSSEDWMVEGSWRFVGHPSTMLRMVPLPTGYAGREELK
jgi:hypothetical protein